jgi:hypothetical protein
MKIQPSQLNASIRTIPLPDLMRELPVNSKGFPVPFFADKVDGEWDFRIMNKKNYSRCIKEHLCWICGQRLGSKKVFVAGPMCVVTRTSAEPPCHYSCAQYAAIACPFLAMPKMRRNEKDLPEGWKEPAGVGIMRNPGVTAVLITRSYRMFNDGNGGALVEMGPPDAIEWYAERGRASRKQVMDSIESGLTLLIEQCGAEKTEHLRQEAHQELANRVSETMRWLPDDDSAPALADLAKKMKRNPWDVPASGG